MGTVIDSGDPVQTRRGRPAASFGLVIELVDSEGPPRARGREGVIHMGSLATVCVVEHVPVVGDVIVIRGATQGVVETVRITRHGRVVIHVRPVP